jgi:hypothetical protein
LPGDLWECLDDVSVAIRLDEVTVGDSGRRRIFADENIHTIMILPEAVHEQLVKAAWLPQRAQDMLPDKGAERLLGVLFHALLLFVLLGTRHQSSIVLVQ